MTKDTEPLQEALTAHYPTGEWMQPCGNHVLCCSCNENLWGVDRDACKAAWRMHVIEALATPASDVVAGGEALREATAKYADMGIDERAEAMADNCDGDPWELIGYFREKLRQSQARVDAANNAATGFAKKLAALKGPAA